MDFLPLPASFSLVNLTVKPPPPPLLLPRSSRKPPPETNPPPPPLTAAVRRPSEPSPLRLTSVQPPASRPSSNPSTTVPTNPLNPLGPKLWLSGKLAPPPLPPPPPPLDETSEREPDIEDRISPASGTVRTPDASHFRVEGKIFVGNLPKWAKKNDIAEFFRQFGPVKKVELIKDHDDQERSLGYCFLFYGGPTAEDSAARAVEFDGVEFHGRVLTVRLDDGSHTQVREEERARWVEGSDHREYRSKWHEERDIASKRLQKILDTKPEDWQAVVSSFEKIPKV